MHLWLKSPLTYLILHLILSILTSRNFIMLLLATVELVWNFNCIWIWLHVWNKETVGNLVGIYYFHLLFKFIWCEGQLLLWLGQILILSMFPFRFSRFMPFILHVINTWLFFLNHYLYRFIVFLRVFNRRNVIKIFHRWEDSLLLFTN